MNDWKSVLNADAADWLLGKDNLSIRYWTLKSLLYESENNLEVAEVKEKISESEVIRIYS
ncbi:MAG: hypothetical protein ACE5KD_03980 [Candidatus Bathyarchaeia archaeon]